MPLWEGESPGESALPALRRKKLGRPTRLSFPSPSGPHYARPSVWVIRVEATGEEVRVMSLQTRELAAEKADWLERTKLDERVRFQLEAP